MEPQPSDSAEPEKPATRGLIEKLYADGLLTPDAYREAISAIYPQHA